MLSDTITSTDSLDIASTFDRTYDETVTLSDTITKYPQRILTDTVTLSDEISRLLGRTLDDTITLTDSIDIYAELHKILDETINLSDTIKNVADKIIDIIKKITEKI